MSTFTFQNQLSRRALLRGAGITLGLPLLEAMTLAFAKAQEARQAKRLSASVWPSACTIQTSCRRAPAGNYKPSRYLAGIQDIREDFTVISGSSHPGVEAVTRPAAASSLRAPMRAVHLAQHRFAYQYDGRSTWAMRRAFLRWC